MYGDRVEYTLTTGEIVKGHIIAAGDPDKIGDAHGIQLDTDPANAELHWVGTGLVRPTS